MQQDKVSKTAYFMTLTYDDKNNSIDRSRKGYLSLSKKHVQNFIKKVRNVHVRKQSTVDGIIKYYAVGEYGSDRKRPHYHVLLFNVDLKLMMSKQDILVNELYGYDGKSRVQCYQWEHGHITVGMVNGASVGYSLKYISKEKTVPMHQNDDRVPEFALISKGIGESYLTDAIKVYHLSHPSLMFCTTDQGVKLTMPRYYKDKIYNDLQRQEAIDHYSVVREKKLRANFLLWKSDPIGYNKAFNEAVKAAFKRMHKQALQNQTL